MRFDHRPGSNKNNNSDSLDTLEDTSQFQGWIKNLQHYWDSLEQSLGSISDEISSRYHRYAR